MTRVNKLWIGPLVGFLIGLVLAENDPIFIFLFGSILATAGFIVQFIVQYAIVSLIKRNMSFLKKEENFMDSFLILAARIAAADGEVSESEKSSIRKRLEVDFKPEEVNRFMDFFEEEIKTPSKIESVFKVIDFDFDQYTKTHLLYFLVSIATADGILTESELVWLKKIARSCGIRSPLSVVLRSFQFKREQFKQHSQRPNPKTAESTLKAAYALLGVVENASVDAIKKAYRKLAKKHHPDKVSHLGESHQRVAKEKFQLIADAYELIKTKRGF